MTIPNFSWLDSTAERYTEQLEVLPPRAHRGDMFLLGEPMDHTDDGQGLYTVHNRAAPTHDTIVDLAARRYLVGSRPVTVAEFMRLYSNPGGTK